MDLTNQIVELLRKTATQLPEDIVKTLKEAYQEETNPIGKEILHNILANLEKAKSESKPICQDTGIPIFYVKKSTSITEQELTKQIIQATNIATEQVPLRPNAVDCITGKSQGNVPIIHFKESIQEPNRLSIKVLLKGGGSENISQIYKLPCQKLDAHRNLDGVRKCIIDSIFQAQGKGCPPYIVGVAIGSCIEEVAHLSKQQLLRKIDDKNNIPVLQFLENQTLKEINQLSIGPLGLGGNTTCLGVKITSSVRHPASYFVGISISCWALRKGELTLSEEVVIPDD